MGLTLAPRASRRRVNIDNRDPEQVFDRGDELPATESTAPPKARPRLRVGADPNAPIPDDQAGVAPDLMEQTVQQRPTEEMPYSKRDLDAAELEDLEANKPKDKNGRWGSFVRNGLEGMSSAARMAMQTGRNPLAAGLGGFLGRGAAGAITPSLDEETQNEERKDVLRRQIAYDQEREAAESDVQYKKAKPLFELKKLGNERAIADQNDARYRREETGRNARAVVAQNGRDLDREENTRHNKALEGNAARDDERAAAANNKIPDTYYRGKDDGRVKDESLAEVLSRPEYHEKSVRPEVLKAFGTQEAIIKAVRNNEINISDVFTDPSKGPMFQRDLAATYSRKAGEAQEFDRALNMTSKSPSAVRITYAGFESAWTKFASDLQAAGPKNRRSIRDKFERYLAGVRVVGE